MIAAASTSPLGILALLILVLALVAVKFFAQAGVLIRLAVFLLGIGCSVAFAFTIANTGKSSSTTSIVPSLATTVGPSSCGVIPDSSQRLLTSADLSSLGGRQLKIARNEIYARHGYAFKTTDMKDYFANCGWYKPSPSPPELSGVEQANIALIRRREAGQ